MLSKSDMMGGVLHCIDLTRDFWVVLRGAPDAICYQIVQSAGIQLQPHNFCAPSIPELCRAVSDTAAIFVLSGRTTADSV